MSALAAPLTLAEQIDAMLMGWLEASPASAARSRRPAGDRGAHDRRHGAPDIEAVCANWAMTVERPARGRITVIEGPARVVEGLAEIASLFRR